MAGFGAPTDRPEAPFDLLDDLDRPESFPALSNRETLTRPLPALPAPLLQAMFRGAHRP